jgi:hypothetical protein
VKLSIPAIHRYCRKQGDSLTSMLRDAGVSRTAYYSLTRRDSVLPRSVHAMARTLGVCPSDLLEEESETTQADAIALVKQANRIVSRYPGASFENVWHTLMLLREPPAERLSRSLRRGRNVVTDK